MAYWGQPALFGPLPHQSGYYLNNVFALPFTFAQVLEEAARRIDEDTPWYAKLGLAFEESEGTREVTVEMVLASNVTQELIEAARKTVLAPAFEVMKGLIGAVQDAATAREEVLELITHCVGISKRLLLTQQRGTNYLLT